jgi:hypothetical protein
VVEEEVAIEIEAILVEEVAVIAEQETSRREDASNVANADT